MRGIVGTVSRADLSGHLTVRFTLATTRAYRNGEGTVTLETTWLTCIAHECRMLPKGLLESLEKQSKVELKGFVRTGRYMRENGSTETVFDIIVTDLHILPQENQLLFQSEASSTICSAREALEELASSGYRPFASPAPSSTEVKLRNCITSAISLLEQAQALENDLGYLKQ